MKLAVRLSHLLAGGLCLRRTNCPVTARLNVNGVRHFGQPAGRHVEEEEEEVEIDPRKLPTNYDPATFNPRKHSSPPTERVFQLVDEIAGLTLSETAELSSIMMRKMGVKGTPAVAVMRAGVSGTAGAGVASKGQAAPEEEKKTEKTVFELKLESFDAASKIKVIKEVRSFTNLGLKEAKDLVEKMPAVFKAGVSKEEGEQIIEKMKALGAKVVME